MMICCTHDDGLNVLHTRQWATHTGGYLIKDYHASDDGLYDDLWYMRRYTHTIMGYTYLMMGYYASDDGLYTSNDVIYTFDETLYTQDNGLHIPDEASDDGLYT